ncbi:MAG: ion transporter [Bacteroidetes bacterium]|nr:ion transporter [Bacteroidota bacterium]
MAIRPTSDTRLKLRRIIFDSDTPAGRRFDLWLLWVIVISIACVMAESVQRIDARFGLPLRIVEWTITVLFTVEYALRVWTAPRPWRYVLSFYGVLDLLAIVPTYLSVFVPGSQSLLVVRALRLTRVFRIMDMGTYVHEARLLLLALLASRHRIIVFMLAVLALVTVFGAIIYVIEPREAGFTSIPRSIYWAIVTLTTVGYGDIAPVTWLGQVFASIIMILGYAIIAIPTGIVTVELGRQARNAGQRACPDCGATGHVAVAKYCHRCGHALEVGTS